MCEHLQHKEKESTTYEKKFRLAEFFNTWWDKYCEKPAKPILPEQYKAVNAMQVCRTAVLGIDYYACPDCGEINEVYHSCKHRFCPTCSWNDTVQWAEKIKEKMLGISHRHVVFTLPHKLIPLLKLNRRAVLNILSRSAAGTFKNWMKNKFNIKPGIILVIHTFGEKKNMHPHVHMIVSWGGIGLDDEDLHVIEDDFVKYEFLAKKFRCLFEDALVDLFDKKQLNHKFVNRVYFMRFLKRINKSNWRINLEPPMETPTEVIRYIGRYSKRACLSEYKITNIEGEFITFKYKDYYDRDEFRKPKEKFLTLHYRKFFPRLLQHVAPPRFPMVRYYGVYTRFKKIPPEFQALCDEPKLTEQIEEQQKDSDPKYCNNCSTDKEYIHTVLDARVKKDRTEPFDIQNHEHTIFVKFELLTEENQEKYLADLEKKVKKIFENAA